MNNSFLNVQTFLCWCNFLCVWVNGCRFLLPLVLLYQDIFSACGIMDLYLCWCRSNSYTGLSGRIHSFSWNDKILRCDKTSERKFCERENVCYLWASTCRVITLKMVCSAGGVSWDKPEGVFSLFNWFLPTVQFSLRLTRNIWQNGCARGRRDFWNKIVLKNEQSMLHEQSVKMGFF